MSDMQSKEQISLRRLLRPFRAPCLLPRQKRHLWGFPHMVRPALVKRKFGNGKRLIGLSPINHRPAYYLVWVDDRWSISNWDSGEVLADHLDEIWETIAEEFGRRDDDDGELRRWRWPEEDSAGGCHWWEADERDIATPRVLRRLGLVIDGRRAA
jgi:hypothetical protein